MNPYKNYICLVCGRFLILKDENPQCDFCKSPNLFFRSPEVQQAFSEKTDSLSPLEFQENLKLEPRDKFYIDLYAGNKEKQKEKKEYAVYKELLYKKYVYNNPLFDQAKFDMRAEWEYENAVEMEECHRRAAEEASRPRCPKCGCTEFQMVPRKWSPLTGFLTNKVDRVCVKCKTRF